MIGRPFANSVFTETPFFSASPRVSSITSCTASFISTRSDRGDAFCMSARIRSTTAPARSVSLAAQASASLTSCKSGGFLFRKFNAAMTLLRAAATGWLTSCVIEAVSCSIVTTRFACASSLCNSRSCRSRRVISRAMAASAAKSVISSISFSVKVSTRSRARQIDPINSSFLSIGTMRNVRRPCFFSTASCSASPARWISASKSGMWTGDLLS